MRFDRTRTADAKGRAMTRRQMRRDKSARLFLAFAFTSTADASAFAPRAR